MSTIEEFISAWAEAKRTCDAAATEGLLTEDFVGIGPWGFELPKAAWLGRFGPGWLHYDELTLDEVWVREYPNSALARARRNVRGTARGNPMPTARASLAVVRIDGAWKLAGIHYSFIAGAPGAPSFPASSFPASP